MNRREMLEMLSRVPFAGLLPAVTLAGTTPDTPTLEALVRQLDSDAPAERCAAAMALRAHGPQAAAALPGLIRMLADRGAEWGDLARAVAAEGVGDIATNEESAVVAILRLLRHQESSSRFWARCALDAWLERTRPSPGRLRPVIDALLAARHDSDPAVRSGVLRTLGTTRNNDPRIVAALLEGLADPEEEIRSAAVCGLGYLALAKVNVEGAAAGVPAMVALLDHKEIYTRESALTALGAVGPTATKAIPNIGAVLDDPEFWVRLIAVDTLERLAVFAPTPLPYLRLALADSEAAVRNTATQALARLGAS